MTKIQVRFNVFETNSSSVHNLVLCTKEQFDRWVNGEVVLDSDSFVDVNEEVKKYPEDFMTYESWTEMEEYETFKNSIKTPSGEEIIAFGYYGYSG